MKIQLPETIDLSYPERFILTIELSPDGFSFSIYSPIVNSSYFYQPLKAAQSERALTEFKETYFDNEFFSLPFRKVFVLNNTNSFTYIPSLVFEEKDKKTYMDYLFARKKGKLLHQELFLLGLNIIHEIEEESYDFICRSFPDAVFIHHTAPMISYLHDRVRLVNAGRMIVNISPDNIDILCFMRDKFLFGNQFRTKDKNDRIYYVLFLWKQLKFDQQKDFIYIAGPTDKRKELIEELKQYIYNIIPVNIIPEQHFEQIDTGAIPFELASLTLCEL